MSGKVRIPKAPCTRIVAQRVIAVPKRVVRARKDEHRRAKDEDDDGMVLLDQVPGKATRTKSVAKLGSGSTSQSQSQTLRTQRSFVRPTQKKPADDSETESETEDEDGDSVLDRKPPALPTPEPESEKPDRGLTPGRIIGSTYPFEDFKANTAQGDLVTKAVEDLCVVISEVVLRPFAARRTEEMVQCMAELRRVCLEEDEVDAWNACVV